MQAGKNAISSVLPNCRHGNDAPPHAVRYSLEGTGGYTKNFEVCVRRGDAEAAAGAAAAAASSSYLITDVPGAM